jgi:hypothetical protein
MAAETPQHNRIAFALPPLQVCLIYKKKVRRLVVLLEVKALSDSLPLTISDI